MTEPLEAIAQGFEADWLTLREPADHAARDPELKARFLAAVTDEILDLGCGTGSTFRALAPGLDRPCHWRLADHDPHLLAAAKNQLPNDVDISFEEIDLNDFAALSLSKATSISASALFDLCSEGFVRDLFARLTVARVPAVYAALNYNGIMRWSMPHILDRQVTAAFNLHQTTDKGFGPAMGASSSAGLVSAAEAVGYVTSVADSAWRLGANEAALQDALHRGIADAVSETRQISQAALDDWLAYRLHCAQVPESLTTIGHTDVLALLH